MRELSREKGLKFNRSKCELEASMAAALKINLDRALFDPSLFSNTKCRRSMKVYRLSTKLIFFGAGPMTRSRWRWPKRRE